MMNKRAPRRSDEEWHQILLAARASGLSDFAEYWGQAPGIALKTTHGKHLVELKRELNQAVGYQGVQLVTISRPTAYGEYAPYHFVDTEQEFRMLVKGLRP